MSIPFSNPYLLCILFFLVGVFFLDTLADLLNISHLNEKLPEEFAGIFNPQDYQKSLHYQKDSVYLELTTRFFFLLISLFFILGGGFNAVDHFSRQWNLNSILTGLIFVGTLSLLKTLLQIPFSLYDTFVLEERYGFNKTTLSVFFSDLLKAGLLGVVLGGLIFSGVVYFFESVGPQGWLISWIAVTVVQLLLIYLAPAFLMPLFNKFTPLAEGPLKNAIEDYAEKSGFHLSGIFTMDSSKRSTKSNAFFTGFGKFRRLVLFDTLVSKHTTDELVAILAHEVGHFKKKHILKSMILSILVSGLYFYGFGFFLNNPQLFRAFQMDKTSVYASIVLIGFLTTPVSRIFAIFSQKISRNHEFEADAFAKETYGHPEILISALKKLSVDSLSHLTPHPLKVALDYSHPPVTQRIRELERQ